MKKLALTYVKITTADGHSVELDNSYGHPISDKGLAIVADLLRQAGVMQPERYRPSTKELIKGAIKHMSVHHDYDVKNRHGHIVKSDELDGPIDAFLESIK